MKIKSSEIPLLIFSLVLPQLAGFVGSLFTFSQIPTWYATLDKPPISPPNWVFGPVWTTLYILMGIAFFMVARRKADKKVKDAKAVFYKQLALNSLWSIAFFGFNSTLYGLIVIVPLWIAIFISINKFSKISKKASYLLWPYLAWVSFASILNFWLYILNP